MSKKKMKVCTHAYHMRADTPHRFIKRIPGDPSAVGYTGSIIMEACMRCGALRWSRGNEQA